MPAFLQRNFDLRPQLGRLKAENENPEINGSEMQQRVSALYVFYDRGMPNLSKVGMNTDWPFRFEQAQAHSPRGIDVAAAWFIEDRTKLGLLERTAHDALRSHHHTETHGSEWFSLAPDEAVNKVRLATAL
jgi:hypothetical protein